MTDKKVPMSILIVPAIWSIIGFFAALSLGITEDTGLLVAGVVAVPLLLYRKRSGEEISTAKV